MSACSSSIKPQFTPQQHRTETPQQKTQQQSTRNRQCVFKSQINNNLQGKTVGGYFSNLIGQQLNSIRADSRQGEFSKQCGAQESRPVHSGRGRSNHGQSEGCRGSRGSHHAHSGRGHSSHGHSEGTRGGRGSHHAHGGGRHKHHSGGVQGNTHSHHAHNSQGTTHTVGGNKPGNHCGHNSSTTVPSTDKGVTLQVKGILQGAYNADTGLMGDALREQNLLPGNQPYANLGHTGSESISASTLATVGDDAPTDWVLIELRDKNNPEVVISSQAALIQRDGDVANADDNTTDLHFDVPEGEYFVTLGHRNHLDVTTSKTVELGGENGTLVDFTDPATVQGSESVNINGEAALWAGDANGDNSVIAFGPDNDADAIATTVLTSAGNPNFSFDHTHFGYSNSDVNLDGFTSFTGSDSDKEVVVENENNAGGNSTNSENFVLNGSTQRN